MTGGAKRFNVAYCLAKLFAWFVLFIFMSLPASGLAQDDQDEIDSKIFLNLQAYNVPLGGVLVGTGSWLKKNYKVCSANEVYIIRNDEGGDPDSSGCYIVYGPINQGMTKWVIQSLIIDKGKTSSFEFEFAFGGKDFIFTDFRFENMDMTKEKFQAMFMDIVNSEEARRFGR